jgi:hypothetical protein
MGTDCTRWVTVERYECDVRFYVRQYQPFEGKTNASSQGTSANCMSNATLGLPNWRKGLLTLVGKLHPVKILTKLRFGW